MTGVASASSHLAGYDAPRVIAGIGPDQNYGWVSATANGSSDWLSVDLGKAVDLGRIKYDTRFGLTFSSVLWQTGFRISVSEDGVNWTEVVNKSGQTSPSFMTSRSHP